MLLLALISCLLAVAIGQSFAPKRLAGPPEEFALHRIPDPKSVMTQERSATHNIWFDTTLESGAVYNTTVPVDGPGEFVFTFSSPHADKLDLELIDPRGNVVDLNEIRQDGTFPIGTTTFVPIETYIVKNSIQGFYVLNVYLSGMTEAEANELSNNPYPNALLSFINNDYLEIHSHLATYVIDVGDTVGIVSTLINNKPGAVPSDIHVTQATMDIITPDGKDMSVEMHTDPTRFGAGENYGAVITATIPGDYLVQARLEGWLTGSVATDVIPFVRTTDHVIAVSPSSLTILGTAEYRPVDKDHVWIDINVKLGNDIQPTLRAYAEVWGIDTAGQPKAACWIGGISDLSTNLGSFVSLELDTKWLQRAGVHGPLTLKNVYIADIDNSYPVANFDNDIHVQNSERIPVLLLPGLVGMPYTYEMRVGVNPLPRRNRTRTDASPSLFLLPGYCAAENPWQKNSGVFDNAAFFVSKGNFGHDEYAQKALSYISTYNPPSFSLVGHSQGGFVALHIYNYYFSGLENAQGGRLIQTIGTPWQGCSIAGDAAALGKIFGVGCGANTDLTRDGATNWLTGISSESRQAVHSYTTTYQQGNFFGDYCSLPLNILLQWPNDGTTELKYGTLPGGVYEGNTMKQCHTSGMQYSPQTDDNTRNAQFNSLAAR